MNTSSTFEKHYRMHEGAEILGLSLPTIRQMIRRGELYASRTTGGHRRVPKSELERLLGKKIQTNKLSTEPLYAVLYARVSSKKQQNMGNLDRQVERLQTFAQEQRYTIVATITDVGSGLNEQRKGLQRLLRMAEAQQMRFIIIEFRDRLARFGYKYLEQIFRMSNIIVVTKEGTKENFSTEEGYMKELVDDLTAIIYSFSGKLYGYRSAQFKVAKHCAKHLKQELLTPVAESSNTLLKP